ncbi:hypothetical protein AALP_AAs61551U000500 [Arabis alpina]|uniref:B box-type domain-containing protein n=1 Tax=Arabis alpina TaxID=50452 RepID=A0A087FZS9_ARAAL|nr:hypothetical protein AALP_AAs61551U000500 [Arabis alpina]
MCRAIKEEERRQSKHDGGCTDRVGAPVSCELCGDNAAVYCEADTAFLCRKCDQWVHSANFLAQRHVRHVICTVCRRFTRRCYVGENYDIVLPEIRRRTARREEDSSDHKVPFVFF